MIRFRHLMKVSCALPLALVLLVSIFGFTSQTIATPNRQNGVIMQYFHWYNAPYSGGNGLWREVERAAPVLARKGITAIWLPPAYKGASGIKDVGYGVYDHYDLGEFDQKGSIPTKYGTRQEYQAAISSIHHSGMDVYADVVLNQMLGGDEIEKVPAVEVQSSNRNIEIPGTSRTIAALSSFLFKGRGGQYSPFTWHWQHFTGSDADEATHKRAIFKYRGQFPGFQEEVDHENGNYDYLLGHDLDMRHPEVRSELKTWGKWYVNHFSLDGVRLDAVKHIPFQFIPEWLDELRARTARGHDLFAVGEYWSTDPQRLGHYIEVTQGKLSLYDVPLHQKFFEVGQQGGAFDLRTLLDHSLMKDHPNLAVTFVDNHDTQPLQSLQSPVADWFKPQAYAVILLRQAGYPIVFYPDYFGATYTDHGQTIRMQNFQKVIDVLLYLRYKYAYGTERDYFDHPDVVGWTRSGDATHPNGLVVLISDNRFTAGSKRMCLGGKRTDAVRRFTDFTRSISGDVTLDAAGCGTFTVKPGSFSAWIEQ